MSINVELSVENTNKYFKRFTLKEKYKGHEYPWIYIFPKEKDILKYWKYRKCLKHIDGVVLLMKKFCFLLMKINS